MDGLPALSRMQHTSEQPQSGMDIRMIVVRMATGMRSHFHIRATEWVMLFPSIALGIVLLYQDTMFETSPSFNVIAAWGDEKWWSLLVLLCALLRTAALVVNGTFRGFGISPHMRLVASFAGVAFWSQFGLGFAVAALTGNGSMSGPVAYTTFCLMEVLNITRSWSDVIARRR